MTDAQAPAAPRARGFTLLEVMIALAVVGIGLVAASSSIAQLTANGVYLRDKTLAHWIAMNKLAEMRVAESQPETGDSEDDVEYAGREWHWKTEVTATDVPALRRIDITVSRKGEGAERIMAKLAGFAGQPRLAAGLPAAWTGTIPGQGPGETPGDTPPADEPPVDDGGGGDAEDDGDDPGEEAPTEP